jgi:benzylsuccinate CoA-transferase BbsF subunit
MNTAKKFPGVFDDLIVFTFSTAVVGPLTMKFFADHGATVIRVETATRPDVNRTSAPYKDGIPGVTRGGYFNYYHSNILSLSLNMKHPDALDICKKLVSKSDIFMENRAPGVVEKWGLGYEELKTVKPDIIMLRQNGYGSWGPYSQLPAFGMVLGPIAGLPNFIGWPGKEPLPIGVSAYTDCISPRFATAAVIAALDYRNKTGKGQMLDLSQFETAIYYILPGLLEYLSSGKEPERIGNASPFAAPHGVYPCRGEDRWCTIAVFDDDQWSAMCSEMGTPELASDPRFDNFMNRKKYEADLNDLVSRWTSELGPEQVMSRLQAVDVPAGVVSSNQDVFNDPQLRSRNLFWSMKHSEVGEVTHLGQSFELSETPAQARTPSPMLGEHTEQICTRLLGMSDEEFIGHLTSGLFE